MTKSHLVRPVVIGIDGGDDGDRALRYGLEEARRRHVGVRLVHVPPTIIATAPMSPLYAMPDLGETAARVLDDAVERVLELAPDIAVEGLLGRGSRTDALVDEARKASCVVLGTREFYKLRVFGRSTSIGVASHADCPVVAVPPSWSGTSSAGRVVVGVDDHGGPAAVLERAFEQAEQREAELVVVHGWVPPSPYEPALVNVDRQGWRKLAAQQLNDIIEGPRAKHPSVAVTTSVVLDSPAAAVLETAMTEDLVVVGRHRTSIALSHRLGSVARHAVHAGVCPVEIVPPHLH